MFYSQFSDYGSSFSQPHFVSHNLYYYSKLHNWSSSKASLNKANINLRVVRSASTNRNLVEKWQFIGTRRRYVTMLLETQGVYGYEWGQSRPQSQCLDVDFCCQSVGQPESLSVYFKRARIATYMFELNLFL